MAVIEMRQNAYAKNIRRTIFGSFGRYLAILAIVALGVGFFAGVKNTKDSMLLTYNDYLNEYKMYDYKLISTYGFTDEDVEALAKVRAVDKAEGSVSQDFFSVNDDGNSRILTAHSITEDVNLLNLSKGRLPRADDECVVDEHGYGSDAIGKTVKVTDENDKETKEAFSHDEYKIVGIVQSPVYITKVDRGTTSLGEGRINAFVYMPREGFTAEYYTEMYLTCKEQGFIYSDEYNNNIKAAKGGITTAAEERGNVRFEEIKSAAQEEIDKAQKELDDGKAEYTSGKATADAELSKAKTTLDQKSSELSSNKKNLRTQKANLASQKINLTSQRQGLATQREQAAAGLQQAQNALAAAQAPGSPATAAEIAQLQAQVQTLTNSVQQIDAGIKKIDSGLQQIDAGQQQIVAGEKKVADGEKQLNSGYNEYYNNKSAADAKFAEAEQKIADGEKELADAKEELTKMEKPELYTQIRKDNTGYDSYKSNSEIVDGIARVFPVFFFLIAALVCSTTMSRMVEEERTQIGVLRALGYTSGRIIRKYMIYSGSAAVIGCIAGFLAGSKYFPYAIWIAYGMMFGFTQLKYYMSWPLAVTSLIVALICSVGTTYLACRGQLKNKPAEILRPKAPKAGKRILLERIGFIWQHLSFLHKVTARNVFRYKKRMMMMILGIGGCTALVLTGFGIKDSIAGVADHQYSEIEKYQIAVGFSEELDEEELAKFQGEYGDDIGNIAVLQDTSVNIKSVKATKTCSLMISGDDNIDQAISFKTADNKKLAYPGENEAMINNKLASMLGVKTGDKVTIEYGDTKSVQLTVSGIYKNYVSNYVYISSETYEKSFQKKYEPTAAFITFKGKSNVYRMSDRINDYENIAYISINKDVQNRVGDMMVSLNYIIILVIGCAGALAFIVLFNLGNINITEREREIATIKVLGFYPRETGSYVFRENLLLVLFGIAVGLPAGMALHKFVMSQIIVDMVSFNEVIELRSFAFTVIVVLGFAFIVDVILRRKLRRINMAEALKSIE